MSMASGEADTWAGWRTWGRVDRPRWIPTSRANGIERVTRWIYL